MERQSAVSVKLSRQREPGRIIGHPDLASWTTIMCGETLYISIAEAIYRERQGEEVEIHLTPTEEDREALTDLRHRTRRRWEEDHLPDGWTQPLHQPKTEVCQVSKEEKETLPEDLQVLAHQILTRQKNQKDPKNAH